MTSDSDVVVAAVARTPFGRFNGVLRERSGPELGAGVIDQVCARTTLPAGVKTALPIMPTPR